MTHFKCWRQREWFISILGTSRLSRYTLLWLLCGWLLGLVGPGLILNYVSLAVHVWRGVCVLSPICGCFLLFHIVSERFFPRCDFIGRLGYRPSPLSSDRHLAVEVSCSLLADRRNGSMCLVVIIIHLMNEGTGE